MTAVFDWLLLRAHAHAQANMHAMYAPHTHKHKQKGDGHRARRQRPTRALQVGWCVCVWGGGVTDKAATKLERVRSAAVCVRALHTTQTIPSLNCNSNQTPTITNKRNAVCRRRRHNRQAEQRGALPLPARRVAGSRLFVRLRFSRLFGIFLLLRVHFFYSLQHIPKQQPSNKHQHRRNAHIRARRAECYEPSVMDSCCLWFGSSGAGNAAAAVKYADMSLTVGSGAGFGACFVLVSISAPQDT